MSSTNTKSSLISEANANFSKIVSMAASALSDDPFIPSTADMHERSISLSCAPLLVHHDYEERVGKYIKNNQDTLAATDLGALKAKLEDAKASLEEKRSGSSVNSTLVERITETEGGVSVDACIQPWSVVVEVTIV
jgi:hypothetical protein